MRTDVLLPLALDGLHAHVALVDASGVITTVNRAWRRFAEDNGYPDPSAGVGVDYVDLCRCAGRAEPTAAEIADGLERVLTGVAESFEHEYPCHAPTEQRWFRVQIGGYEDEAGQRGAVVAHENITTLKLAESDVRGQRDDVQAQLDRARAELVKHTRLVTIGQVAASIAHDLRNPLGAIRNAVYLLKKKLGNVGPEAVEDAERYLTIIDEEVSTSDHIIADLMALAHGKPPVRTRIDAGVLVDETIRRMPGASGAVTAEVAPGVELYADAGQLVQVLTNLISNGLDACDRAGRNRAVTLRIAADERRAEIIVGDAGDGVPEGEADRVFEPLYSTRTRGTGLGLAICRQLVRSHGGHIAVSPDPDPLGGARFVVELPGPASVNGFGLGGTR